MKLIAEQLRKIAGGKPVAANINSIVLALDRFGAQFGLDKPHRLGHFIPQIAHESGGFRFDREIWGPTPAQKKYEGRADLGNTTKGDGQKFAGRGPIQLTGRGNVTRFEEWCRTNGYDPPDFSDKPDLINTDPWEGLSAIWFWSVGNQTKKTLNIYADENNIEMITRLINGGLNGFDDRIRYYVRAALVMLGHDVDDVTGFQAAAQKKGLLPKDTADKKQVDGIAGPQTRAAMHMALVSLMTDSQAAAVVVKAAPVTSETVVAVKTPGMGPADAATGAGVGAGALGGTLQTLQDQLTPFSMAGGWIGKLVIALIVIGALLTIGGLAWRWYASRKKAKALEALNVVTVKP